MTDYIFKPDPSTSFVSWTNPNIWTTGIVPDGHDADVFFRTVIRLDPVEGTYTSFITASGTLAAHSISLEGNYLLVPGTLNVDGLVSILPRGEIDMQGGSLTAGSINNNGIDIQGPGTINTQLLVSLTNIVGNGLTINATSFVNSGMVQAASGTLTINTQPGGFSNLSNGTLTGGSYHAGNGGVGSALYLNAGDMITTNAASITLSNGATIYMPGATGGSVSLQSTLHDISSGGELHLSSRNYAFDRLTVAGKIFLEGGSATLGGGNLSVSAGAIVQGTGTISSAFQNDGIVRSDLGSTKPLLLSGSITGSGSLAIGAGTLTTLGRATILQASTFEIGGSVAQDVRFENNIGQLIIDNPASFSGTIYPMLAGPTFANSGNVITLKGVSLQSITGTTYSGDSSGGVLTLNQITGAINLHFGGSYSTDSFSLAEGTRALSSDPESLKITVNAGGGPVCFASGTLILTVRGEVPVEQLRQGDLAITTSGERRPIIWIGHRRLCDMGGPAFRGEWPVRIAVDAFGPGRPHQDLVVSQGHAICIDLLGEVFVPAGRLINGRTITLLQVDEITYWHVELAGQDVLLSNGLPTESYIEAENRTWFWKDTDHAHTVSGNSVSAARWPRVTDGPIVNAVRERLAARAADMGWTSTYDMAPRLIVDGVEIRGDLDYDLVRFIFPSDVVRVELVSSTFVAADEELDGDSRRLGLGVTGITVGDGLTTSFDIPLDEADFDGLYDLETNGVACWRWTNGSVQLPSRLWQTCRSYVVLRIGLVPRGGRRWLAPAGAFQAPDLIGWTDNIVSFPRRTA